MNDSPLPPSSRFARAAVNAWKAEFDPRSFALSSTDDKDWNNVAIA
jgi:hypothetical protein